MGIFDKFKTKRKEEQKPEIKKPAQKSKEVKESSVKEPVKKPEKAAAKTAVKPSDIKGKTKYAYRVLIKPLITEKASNLGVLNKYVFAINPAVNKIEVKKAIRTIYNVEPVAVNISNFSGKKVRYGRVQGVTKHWKKAIVTLKAGDKIEVYEGV